MDIEFDPEKDALNKARRGGISLAAAQEFAMDTALVALNDREDYGEDRWSAVGFIGEELYVLIFTERDGRIRPISLRMAEKAKRRTVDSKKPDTDFESPVLSYEWFVKARPAKDVLPASVMAAARRMPGGPRQPSSP